MRSSPKVNLSFSGFKTQSVCLINCVVRVKNVFEGSAVTQIRVSFSQCSELCEMVVWSETVCAFLCLQT